ncbi:MAG: LysR family transcriptional regulator [Planctomycetota bacterium]
MQIRQLRYVVALAEEGSFSRAAARERVAQPSLSQQISKLERELGQPLFDRLARGVVPTVAGLRLVEDARRILSEIADAQRRVADTKEQVSGTLTVGAIPTVAPFLLPRLVREFVARWPEVEVRTVEDVTERLCDGVVSGKLDLALTSAVDDPRAVHVATVGRERLWVLASRQDPLSRLKSVSWTTLGKQHTLVLHEAHCLAGQVNELCRQRGVHPTVAAQGAQLATIAAMVSEGLGVAVVPDMMRAADRGKSRVYLPFAGRQPKREICVVWSLLRYRTNAARAFERLVRERLA